MICLTNIWEKKSQKNFTKTIKEYENYLSCENKYKSAIYT